MMPDAHFIKPDVSLNQLIVWNIQLSAISDMLGCRRSSGSVIELEPEQQKILADRLDYIVSEIQEITNDVLTEEDRLKNAGYSKANAMVAGVKA